MVTTRSVNGACQFYYRKKATKNKHKKKLLLKVRNFALYIVIETIVSVFLDFSVCLFGDQNDIQNVTFKLNIFFRVCLSLVLYVHERYY